ncbi:MAG: hypothetical protein WC694_03310 [Candidatus Paceibacterota bacterium]|jgi:hypothetical protein
MKNVKNIAKGFLVLAFFVGIIIATPARAENNGSKNLSNAKNSMKVDALMKLDSSSVGVVMGKEGSVKVIGAKVISVVGGDINATVLFGSSPLNFVVKMNTTSKLNGKLLTDIAILNQLKAGDNISFVGIIASSTSSSIVVNGTHAVSQTLFNKSKIEDKTSFQGEVREINLTDNSFILKLKSGLTVKIIVSSNTVITANNIVKTLSSLQIENKVKVTGELNTSGNIITASKVSIESENANVNDNNNNRKENRGGWFGKMLNWFWK